MTSTPPLSGPAAPSPVRRARTESLDLCRNPTNVRHGGRPRPAWRPSTRAICRVSASRGIGGARPVRSADLAQAVAHGVGVHEERAGGGLERRARAAKYAVRVSISVPSARRAAAVDLLDQVAARVAVAGQRPLGQQVVAGAPAGRVRPARRRPGAPTARRGPRRGLRRGPRRGGRPRPARRRRSARRRAAALVGVRRRRPGSPRAGRPARRTARPCPRPRAARRTWSKRSSVRVCGTAPSTTVTPSRGPAEGAGPRGDGLVGLGAQHRVDDQRLEPGVPRAARLGGPGVDLGGGEGDLTGVAEHGGVHRRRRRRGRRSRRRGSRRPRCRAGPGRRSAPG